MRHFPLRSLPALVWLLALPAPMSLAAEPATRADISAIVPACQACHVSPNPNSAAPHIAAQRAGYLAKQLKAFKAGERKDDFMNAIASQLADGEIAALADHWAGQAAGSDAVVPAAVAEFKRSRMAFPTDFPKGYAVYRTQNDTESLSVSTSWANAAAWRAAREHQPLPDGSVIIVANYKAKLDAAGKPLARADGSWVEGEPQSYSGMEARAGWGEPVPALLRNGNWHYNVFSADKTPNAALNQAACLACHKPAVAHSFVFTHEALESAALREGPARQHR